MTPMAAATVETVVPPLFMEKLRSDSAVGAEAAAPGPAGELASAQISPRQSIRDRASRGFSSLRRTASRTLTPRRERPGDSTNAPAAAQEVGRS